MMREIGCNQDSGAITSLCGDVLGDMEESKWLGLEQEKARQ